MALLFPEFTGKLEDDSQEDNDDAGELDGGGFMVVKEDTEEYCEYFASCDYKGYYVLLKLFDHSVDKELSQAAKYGHAK
jgi:hypothetical protein